MERQLLNQCIHFYIPAALYDILYKTLLGQNRLQCVRPTDFKKKNFKLQRIEAK